MNFLLLSYFSRPAGAKGGRGFGWPPRSSGLTSPFGCRRGAGFQTPEKSCGSKAFDWESVLAVAGGVFWPNAPAERMSAAAATETLAKFRISNPLSQFRAGLLLRRLIYAADTSAG